MKWTTVNVVAFIAHCLLSGMLSSRSRSHISPVPDSSLSSYLTNRLLIWLPASIGVLTADTCRTCPASRDVMDQKLTCHSFQFLIPGGPFCSCTTSHCAFCRPWNSLSHPKWQQICCRSRFVFRRSQFHPRLNCPDVLCFCSVLSDEFYKNTFKQITFA
jgi:hypothetical protein